LNTKSIIVGPFEVNCYLAWNPGTRTCLILDPGDDADEIVEEIQTLELQPVGILLTHAHVDHIRGVGPVASRLDIPVWVHPADRALYASPDNALNPWLPKAENLPPISDVPNSLPGLEFTAIHTPGHTPGGVCYYFANSAILFSGDSLFAASVGRSDLPGGNHETLITSITSQLLGLPPETKVHCGHGPSTTIGQEKTSNPFL
jgi:hydroxyacylglutathione hydrolase